MFPTPIHPPSFLYSFGVISFLFTSLTVITTSTVAAAVAANNIAQAQDAVTETAVFAALAGLGAGVLLYTAVPSIVSAMGASDGVAAASIAYSRTRAWGMWAGLTWFVVTGALRGLKDTTTTAVLSAVGVVVNAVLDYVLVLKCGWGAVGAATATALVQVTQVVVGLLVLKQRGLLWTGGGGGGERKPRWHTVCVGERGCGWSTLHTHRSYTQLRTTITSGLQLQVRTISVSALMIMASMQALTINPATLAAHEVLRQIWSCSSFVFLAVSVAVQPLVAGFVAQGDVVRARQATWAGVKLGAVLGVVLGGCTWVLGGDVPRVFINDEHVVALACKALPVVACTMVVEGVERAVEGALLGARYVCVW